MTRACLRLTVVASVSLLLALTCLMFLVDAPAIARWFLASAALTGLSLAAAVVARRFEG